MKPSYVVPASCACALLVLACAQPLKADEEVHRQYQFETRDLTEIEFRGNVGEMHFSPSPDDNIHIDLVIAAEEHGWFSRRKDFDDLELESRVRGSRLVLTMDEEDTRSTWLVKLPVLERTTIDFGVGEVEGSFGATELSIDLGVGEVDIELPRERTGAIELSTGVGEARLRGGRETKVSRAFVSHDIHGRGEGDKEVRIEIGVGEIEVSLR